MSKLKVMTAVLVTLLACYVYKELNTTISNLTKVNSCPFCFGKEFCQLLHTNTTISNADSLNVFNSKNVFRATFNDREIILKKLANSAEINVFDKSICGDVEYCNTSLINISINEEDIIKVLLRNKPDEVNSLKVCGPNVAMEFLKDVVSLDSYANMKKKDMLTNIWTILSINPEPLILQLLNQNQQAFPVPEYLGACGRIVAVADAGARLGTMDNEPWIQRASYAVQLLRAAQLLTDGHDTYRIYLTDVSPDNIAVDKQGKLSIIDLENIILALKSEGYSRVHHSTNFIPNGYAYSEGQICSHSLSDHNYYSICKLILSRRAPWPMVRGGLLHSAPQTVGEQLFELIDECVEPKHSNRFEVVHRLIQLIQSYSIT